MSDNRFLWKKGDIELLGVDGKPKPVPEIGKKTRVEPVDEEEKPQVDERKKSLAVKFVEGTGGRVIEGLAIPFGGPIGGKDFDGEYFSRDTDFCLPWFGPTGRPALYGHGLNPATKADVVGRQEGLEEIDEGLWIQVELDKRSRYHDRVAALVDKGALSFSSGAMPHLVQTSKEDGKILRWPWVEISLTPTPANPLAVAYAVKAVDFLEHASVDDIEALKALDESLHEGGLPDGSPFAEAADRLLIDLAAFMERGQRLASLRAKEGRILSEEHLKRFAAIEELVRTIRSRPSDSEATKRAAQLELERFVYLTTRID